MIHASFSQFTIPLLYHKPLICKGFPAVEIKFGSRRRKFSRPGLSPPAEREICIFRQKNENIVANPFGLC